MSYYKNQLKALTKQISVKFTSAGEDTKWLDLNDECKEAIRSMIDQYNGWPNRETWSLWCCISNYEPWYLAFKGSSADDLKDDMHRMQLSSMNGTGNFEAIDMFFNIGSLWRVDWNAIAEALKGDTP